MTSSISSRGAAGPTARRTVAATPRGPERMQEDGGRARGWEAIAARIKAIRTDLDRFQQRHRRLAFPVAVWKKFGDDAAGDMASLVSYYFFVCLFPLLLAFTSILAFVTSSRPELQARLLDSALANFPVVGDDLRDNVGHIGGNGVALGIGLIGALWGGMGAIGSMQNAMNSIWFGRLRERPNFIEQRLRSFLLLLVFAVAIGATTFLGSAVVELASWPVVGRIAVLLPSLAINTGMYLLAFRVLTDRPLGWRALLPGACVGGVAFTVLQSLGTTYVGHIVGARATYGVFAVVLGLLAWLYLQAQLSVLAAEVNVVRELGLSPRSLFGDLPTEADGRALELYAAMRDPAPAEEVDVDLTRAAS